VDASPAAPLPWVDPDESAPAVRADVEDREGPQARGGTLRGRADHRRLGWCPDYTDPYDFFRPLLHNYSVFDESDSGVLTGRYRDKVETAERLVGNQRLKAFGKLDLEITTKLAPYVPMRTYNNRYLFSNRVDPRSLAFSGVYSDWSIPALALK
jgi:ABC-type oligopeptide transport system substrate-binding subunit